MSKFSDKIKSYLIKYIGNRDIDILEETDAGFKARFDFMIPCKTKILIEVDGNYNKNATCYSNIA